MTDDEKAIDYINNIHIQYNEILSRPEVVDEIRKAYLAGLKTGMETEREYVKNNAFTSMKEQGLFPFGKWHDLRKDPNDVPNDNRYVWTNAGAGYHDNDGWWDDFGRLQGVIAWCEPKFEE